MRTRSSGSERRSSTTRRSPPSPMATGPKFKSERDRLYAHPDLYEWGRDYGGAWKHCGDVPTATEVNVRTMNDECGTGAILDRWRDYVEAHEAYHKASYNKCLYTSRMGAEAQWVENVAARSDRMAEAVENARDQLWAVLGPAAETSQRWNKPEGMRHWRPFQRWTKVLPGKLSHTGTNGC